MHDMDMSDAVDAATRAAWVRSDEQSGRRRLGPNLGLVRRELGLSQAQVARLIDPTGKLRHTTVAKWERGENTPSIKRIPRVLDVAVALARKARGDLVLRDSLIETLTEGEWM
jgi:transcriptional regulator with XRE-family HTH domain